MLSTVEDVIDALGGTSAAAALAGVRWSTVSMWKTRGAIPSDRFLVLGDALKARGKKADPALFGFKEAPTGARA